MFSVSFMLTTKEESAVNTQKVMLKESEYNTTQSNQITKEDSKTGKKEQRICKIVRKQ